MAKVLAAEDVPLSESERERLVDVAKRYVLFAAAAHGITVIAQHVGLASGKRNRNLVLVQRFTHLQAERVYIRKPGPRDRQIWRFRNRDFCISQRVGLGFSQFGGSRCDLIGQIDDKKSFQRIGAAIVRIERNSLVNQLQAAPEGRSGELPTEIPCLKGKGLRSNTVRLGRQRFPGARAERDRKSTRDLFGDVGLNLDHVAGSAVVILRPFGQSRLAVNQLGGYAYR